MIRTNCWIKLFVLGLLIAIFCIPPETILAQDKAERGGFSFGGWAGYGQMNVTTDNDSNNSHGTFALSFRGGYAVTSNVLIGLELNGWTIEAYNLEDPSKGESVSNISLFFNYFPFKNIPLYMTGGGGQLFFTNNSPEVDGRDNGGSWFVGSGYEIPISTNLNFVPQIRYCQGDFTGGSFDVYELAVGINWYSGK